MTPAGGDSGWFSGPGEIRALLRSVVWSENALGPVETWSPVLRTMVQGALASSFPVCIHWGHARIALYNDAFAQLIGGKHPAALARPAKDTWAEAWDVVGARLDEVIDQGHTIHATDEQRILYRHGYPEECYFSFSHSPIEDVHGARGGVLTLAVETSAKVLYQRRMRVVQGLGQVSSTGAGGPTDTCRAVLRVLATARETMPFAVAILLKDGASPHTVAHYGLAPQAVLPGLADSDPDRPGPLDRVFATGRSEEVTGLRGTFPDALLPGPLGPLTPDAAVLLPLTVTGRSDPLGVLVVGVNPYRPLNDEYRAFFQVVARQVQVALGDAAIHEVERHRSQVLADLDRAKMEFFQNVSHELRTPLTVLLAPLHSLLTAAGQWPAAEQQDLHTAVRAAERLNTMADALLDFTGAHARILRPDRRPTDLADLTAEISSMFRSAAEHAGLEFAVELSGSAVTADVDRAMWSTIVTNLLSNAVKYTRQGHIRTRLTATDANAVLTISDTGVGIAPVEQPLIFNRFHRVPGTGEKGSGIGLSVVADMVRAHQGCIDVDSAPGRGTTFTVTLPLATTDLGPLVGMPASPSHVEEQDTDAGETGPKVVLVEDDSDLREFLVRLLSREDWRVTAYAEAETALDQLLDASYDPPALLITDVILPGRDGLSMIEQLRQHPATRRIPMIILTARHGDIATAEGLAAGADDYITKPFSAQELLARAHATYRLSRLREDAVDEAQTKSTHLRIGLDSSRTIGTAVGILMTTHHLPAAAAYQLLVATSQHTNRKLRDIAADVVTGGRLPVRPTVADEVLIRVADHNPTPS